MTSYLVYEWNGQIKWAEIMGCYFVDPLYVEEFKASMSDIKLLPINVNFF
ncbi:hypothetical protein SCACP_40520 [Sporomusa carbonis]